jgi:hypothetical protein
MLIFRFFFYVFYGGENMQKVLLIPAPKKVVVREGFRDLSPGVFDPARVVYEKNGGLGREAYILDIRAGEIRVSYGDEPGKFYGRVTLEQAAKKYGAAVPCMTIEDAPDLALRGVMLDISRNKVPTVETLKETIDMLARLKINHLELYVEGYSYEYPSFKHLFPNETPLSPAEIRELDRYCKDRFIDLVPCQNNLGHMSDWLALPEFAALGESDSGMTILGRTLPPSTLNPLDPGSFALAEKLTGELLESFSSPLYNACLDEPFELGKGKSKGAVETKGLGRVYGEYALKIYGLAGKHHKRMLMWADVLSKHPEAVDMLPRDIVFLEWGYEGNHPFERLAREYQKSGHDFCLCCGTSTWTSFTGRTGNMLRNTENAAANAKKYGALGIIITDWGDGGHPQYLPVSYAGLSYGAALAWNTESRDEIDLASYLDTHVFEDHAALMGRLVLDAGNYYQREEFPMINGTLAATQVSLGFVPPGYIDGMTKQMAAALARTLENKKPFNLPELSAYVEELSRRIEKTAMACPHAQDIAGEYLNNLRMAKLGFLLRHYNDHEPDFSPEERRRHLEVLGELTRQIREEHTRLWLKRNKPGGLQKSLAVFAKLGDAIQEKLTPPA